MPYSSLPVSDSLHPFIDRSSPAHVEDFQGDDLREAVDLLVPEGTPVLATDDGIVTAMSMSSRVGGRSRIFEKDGNWIEIEHPDGSFSQYDNLRFRSNQVSVGRSVRRGQPIAESGRTGYLAHLGPHLHFSRGHYEGERYVTDPIRWEPA